MAYQKLIECWNRFLKVDLRTANSQCRWPMLLTLIIAVIACPTWVVADDATGEKPQYIYVPESDLHALFQNDKKGVLLPREQFESLWQQQPSPSAWKLPQGIAITAARYKCRVVGRQLAINAEFDILQQRAQLVSLPLNTKGLAIEKASWDGQPARLGRKDSRSEVVHFFNSQQGAGTLKMELSAPLLAVGSDQLAIFALANSAVAEVELALPAGKFLLFDNVSVPRPTAADQPASYQLPVGGLKEVRLQITDRQESLSSDSLILATSRYGVRVIPGEVTWQVDTRLSLVGQKLDQLQLQVPKDLEVTEVTSPGLDVWNLSDDPQNRSKTILQLKYRQPFDKSQNIRIRGVKSHKPDDGWSVPQLTINGVDSHVGQLLVQYPPTVRLRLGDASAVRQTASENHKPVSRGGADIANEPFESMRFEFWQEDFDLQFVTETKERELLVDQVTLLESGDDSMSLNVATRMEVLYSPLFDIDIELPAEWIVDQISVGDQTVVWETRMQEAGVQQMRVAFPKPLQPGQELKMILQAHRDYEAGIDDKRQLAIELPFVNILNVDLWSGSYAVRASKNWDVELDELQGLDAIRLKSFPDALSYSYQSNEVAGQLKLTKKQLRVRAETVAYHRLERQSLRSHFEFRLHVDRGLLRTLNFLIPKSVDRNIQFQVVDGAWKILQQQESTDEGGDQNWTLKLAPTGDTSENGETPTLVLGVDLFTPRDDVKSLDAPHLRIKEAEQQSGYLVVEADGEQQLSLTAMAQNDVPLVGADLLELPKSSYRPTGRIVAVYRFLQDDHKLSLNEQRFDRVPFPAAICHQSAIQSLVKLEGELQHQVTYELTTSGVQSIGVSLAKNSRLWAAMVNGEPVEVRRLGTRYLVPVGESTDDSNRRILTLLYSDVADTGQTFRKTTPRLDAMSGAGESQSIEVLKQTWAVYHTDDIAITANRGQFQATTAMDQTGFLSQIKNLLRFPLENTGLYTRLSILAAIGIGIGLLVLLNRRFSSGSGRVRRSMSLVTLILGTVIFGILLMLMFPAVQQARFTAETSAIKKGEYRPSMSGREGQGELESPSADFLEANDKDNDGVSDDPFSREMAQEESMNDESNSTQAKKGGFFKNNQTENMFDPEEHQQGGSIVGFSAPTKRGSNRSRKTRLSIPIQFEIPEASLAKSFSYVGTGTDPNSHDLVLTLQGLHQHRIICWCVALFVVCLGWFLRHRSAQVLFILSLCGLLVPLILAAIAPAHWSAWIDGLFVGTVVALFFGLGFLVLRSIYGVVRFGPDDLFDRFRKTAAIIAFAFISWNAVASGNLVAAEEQPQTKENQKKVTTKTPAKDKKTKPTAVNTGKKQPVPDQPFVYVPYAEGADPLLSPNVFLTHEMYQRLLKNSQDAEVAGQPGFSGVVAASYEASIVEPSGNNGDSARVLIKANYTVYSNPAHYNAESASRRGAQSVTLPIRLQGVQNALMNGKPALIQVDPKNKGMLSVVVSEPGEHSLEFEFSFPLKQAIERGRFQLSLVPVPSGMLTLTLPRKELQVDVQGTRANFRVVTEEDQKQILIPVSAGGEFDVSWRPEMESNSEDAVVHAEAKHAFLVNDMGVSTASELTWNVRRGQLNELLLHTPHDWKVHDISGKDVGGWEMSIEGPTRRLKLFLRREVTDQTTVNISLFRSVDIEDDAAIVAFPELVPDGVTRDVGTIFVAAEKQFTLRPQEVKDLRQIEVSPKDLPAHLRDPSLAIHSTYRYAAHPFQLSMAVARPRGRTRVDVEHAALIGRQQIKMTSRFLLESELAPRSNWSFYVPFGFKVHSVESVGLSDWYLEGNEDEPTLTLEWDRPRSKPVEVVVSGVMQREELDEPAMIDTLHPFEPDRMRSVLAIRVEEGFSAQLEELEEWRVIATSDLSKNAEKLHPQPIQFALESHSVEPIPVMVKLTAQTLSLSADAVTFLTVSDTSVLHTFALQWQIPLGEVQTLWVTTPMEYENRLEFHDPHIRRVSHEKTDDGRLRWRLDLKSPISERHFIAATSQMALPESGLLQPPIISFDKQDSADEENYVALASQRHYVVLVNRSIYQVTANHTENSEIISQSDLPIVVDESLVTEAAEIFRWRPNANKISWQIYQPTGQSQMPAVIHLAHLQQVLARDGSWRTEANYTFRNPNRQFLPLLLPETSRILSVYVAGQPSRVVESTHNGQPLWLIPIPKTSISERSITARVVISGSLTSGKLDSQKSLRQMIDLPAPRVLSTDDSAELGITVAQTRWTVHIPSDVDVELVEDKNKSNVTLVDGDDVASLAYELQLKDALELINTMSLSSNNSLFGNTAQNLADLEQEILKQDGQRQIGGKKGKQLNELRSRFDKWMKGNRDQIETQIANDESNTEADFSSPKPQVDKLNSMNARGYGANDFVTNGKFSYELNAPVPVDASKTEGKDDSSRLRRKKEVHSEIKRDIPSMDKEQVINRRSQIQQQQQQQRESLYLDLKKTKAKKKFNLPSKNKRSENEEIPSSLLRVRPTENAPNKPQFGGGNGGGAPIVNMSGGDFNVRLNLPDEVAKQPAGVVGAISLPIELPRTGGKQLTFSKVAGSPHLTLAIRFEEPHRDNLGWLWSICWGLALFVLIASFARGGMKGIELAIPPLLIVVGIVISLITSTGIAFWGFVLFLIGCLTLGWRLRNRVVEST